MLFECFVVIGIAVASVHGECGPCPDIPKHYEEIGCKAVKENESDCCPARYECPNVKEFDKSKCNYKGKSYAVGDQVSDGLPTCTASCTCTGADPAVGFNCAYNECPEVSQPPKPECALQFTIDSCCSTKTICDAEEIKKLPRCYVDGREYVEGNLIYPQNEPCYKCLCNDKYDNSTSPAKNPFCKRVDCGITLLQLNNLQEGCVPVYFNDNFCCPLEFRCPNTKDSVLPRAGKAAEKAASPAETCTYGDLVLNVGESVKTDDECLECSCQLPPMAQCTRTINTEKCN